MIKKIKNTAIVFKPEIFQLLPGKGKGVTRKQMFDELNNLLQEQAMTHPTWKARFLYPTEKGLNDKTLIVMNETIGRFIQIQQKKYAEDIVELENRIIATKAKIDTLQKAISEFLNEEQYTTYKPL